MSTTRFQTIRRGIDAQGVAVVDVVVEHGGQEVVGQLDGVEIAGEVEVDVLHGDDLGIAAAGRPALHAEARPQRRLAQADRGLLADAVQPVAQADAGGGLAFAGRRGRDRRHQHQLAGRPCRPAGGRGPARPWPCTCRSAPGRRRESSAARRSASMGWMAALAGDFDVGRQLAGSGHGRSGIRDRGCGIDGQLAGSSRGGLPLRRNCISRVKLPHPHGPSKPSSFSSLRCRPWPGVGRQDLVVALHRADDHVQPQRHGLGQEGAFQAGP